MHSGQSRRAVLAAPCAAGVAAVLGGCSTYGGTSDDAAAPPPATPTAAAPPASPTGDASAASEPPPAGPPPLARLADIPVGGGKIFADQRVVVTQPRGGTIKAFSTTCTHAGCEVNKVANGTINCPCHGSKFDVADGSVAGGPAPRSLPPVAVKVTGDAITLA